MIGEKFGKWVVLNKGGYRHNHQYWLCRCLCGIEKEVSAQHLKKEKSTQCLKCSGKQLSDKAFQKNSGKYTGNRRAFHTIKVVENLYRTQKGLCSICGKQLPLDLSKCAWDHDHVTGEGRDLLHKGCNVFLGFVERDPRILDRVIQYCKKYHINYA